MNLDKTIQFYETFFEKQLYIYIWEGFKGTLALTVIASVVGLAIGLIIATIQIAPFPERFSFLGKVLKRKAVILILR